MTIRVVCPHCESRFQLSADLVGKSMRCPNADCREVFEVAEDRDPAPTVPPVEPATVALTGAGRSGSVGDFLPVFEAEPVDHPPVVRRPADDPVAIQVFEGEPADDRPPVAPLLKAARLDAAPILKAAPILPATALPDGPRELVWNARAAPPPPPAPKPAPAAKRIEADDDIPIRNRPTKSPLPKVILFTLVSLVVVILGGVAVAFLYRNAKAEEQAAAAAEETYKEGKFGEARKLYDGLLADYPDSSSRDRYRFFGELASLKGAITAVTTRENPAPAVELLRKFIADNGDSPLAQPNTGFGADVVQAGQLMSAAIADHAGDRVKAFRGTRAKREELAAAERAIAEGRGLIPTLEKFRDKGGQSFDDARAKYDAVEAEVNKEWARLKAIDPWRELAADPTDPDIERFEREMKQAGLAADAEVLALAAAAKLSLRKKVRFATDRRPAVLAPEAAVPLSAFAPQVHGSPTPKPGPDGTADAVFAVVRGVLYVSDAHTGNPLWAERVSTAPGGADAPLRFVSEDGSTDWLITPTLLDNEAGLTARQTRTGLPVWHQPLPAPALGRPARIGGRLFVALKDEIGSIMQLDLAIGEVLSRGELRQPIGGGLAALRGTRSGHGFLVVPADARRVFVFEVGKEDEGGGRVKQPQVVRVLATEHPKDSLRGEPLLIDPDDPTAPRRAVFTQTDLPTTMKLRSFALPNVADLGVPQPESDTRTEQAAEADVNGWSEYPPLSDGERVAVATDSGSFAVFGLNQPGNADKPLFQLPGLKADGEQAAVARGLVVAADEDAYWVVAGGQLLKLRAAVDPAGGFRLTVGTNPRPVGEPIARGQVRAALNLGFVTVKAAESATVHMIAFDLTTGDVVWKRQLGVTPVGRSAPQPGGGLLVVDRGGGVYRLAGRDDSTQLAVESIATPHANNPMPAAVATSPDEKTVWVVIPDATRDEQRLIVRTVTGNKLAKEFVVTTPAPLAGSPVVAGEHLLFPLANGFLYRFAVGDSKPVQGPAWRGAEAAADAACHLTILADGGLAVTDGDRRVMMWTWAATEAAGVRAGGPWETREPITGPVVAFTTQGRELLLVPDAAGVSAFEADKPSVEPVRRWKGAADWKIPAGRASHLTRVGDRAVFVSGGQALVGIDPTQEKAEWGMAEPPVPDAGEVVGVAVKNGSVLVSYLSGHLAEVGLPGGMVTADGPRATGSPLLAGPSVGFAGDRAVVFTTDGTVGVVRLVPR